MASVASHGVKLFRKDGTATVIAATDEIGGTITDIQIPEEMRNAVDTTGHNKTDESSIPSGLTRRGMLTFSLVWDSAEASHTAIRTRFVGGHIDRWLISIPKSGSAPAFAGGTRYVFDGHIVRFHITSPPGDEAVKAEVEVKVTGGVTFTA